MAPGFRQHLDSFSSWAEPSVITYVLLWTCQDGGKVRDLPGQADSGNHTAEMTVSGGRTIRD